MNERDIFNALLRSDLKSFLHRCVLAVNPGAQFVPN